MHKFSRFLYMTALLCIVFGVFLTVDAAPRRILLRNYGTTLIDPDYAVANGVQTQYTLTTGSVDTLVLTGASDSTYTCWWQNWGMGQSISFEIAWDGVAGTAAYVIEIQSANYYYAITDDQFVTKSWVELSGTGQANQKESNTITTNSSVYTATIPVPIWSGYGNYFRLLIYSTAGQSGNLYIIPTLHRIR